MMLKFKEYLRELTISPDYQQKGTFNPFYTVTPEVEKTVKKERFKKFERIRTEITVFFKCELTSVVKDKNNEIVEGSSSQIKAHTDVWTFGRKIGSADPAWKLIATGE